MNRPLHAIVIGAGMAGLASAIRLAVQGYTVTVFEKNNYPGGKLSHFTLNGFQFDAGPSLFTQPQNIEDLFTLANEPIEDYFEYKQEDISCHYFYEDGTQVLAYADKNIFAKELANKLGESEKSLIDYLHQSEKVYKHIGLVFLEYSLHKLHTFWKAPIWQALKTVRWSLLFQSLDTINKKYFKNPKTVQLFNRYATYNGSNPYKAPGMLSLIPHLEHNEGSFYPKGGMISITNALYQLALKKGVTFHFNSQVEKITREGNTVTGVVVGHEHIPAGLVISNMDVYFTYLHLLGNQQKAKKILKQERSSSALIFYWGINASFNQLGLHNIFFTENYQEEFKHLFQTKDVYPDPTVYINITSKCEPGIQAPLGKENWFVMINVPANIGQDWDAYKITARAAIIKKLNRLLQTDIERYLEAEEVLDPILIESRTASYMGSLYGTSSNSKMAAFLRHPNFSDTIKGLYFVGGSVHPGGGIPLCLKSARIMSEMVKEDHQH